MAQDTQNRSLRLIALAGLILLTVLLIVLLWYLFLRNPPGGPTPQPPVAGGPQTITIEAPRPGDTISSPANVRGRTAFVPFEANLVYQVLDAGGTILGEGPITVQGELGQPGIFDASIEFDVPAPGPGQIVIIDDNEAGGAPFATATVEVNLTDSQTPVGTAEVLPTATLDPATPESARQTITIESPAPGTQVGSPVVITGRTTQFPFDGDLGYRIIGADNRQLGIGTLPVVGNPGEPTAFNASITFQLPASGGPITVEVFDQNAATGAVVASSSLPLTVAPPPTEVAQQITIDSPPPGTVVGSPVVVTGRTTQFPFQGTLGYRISDAGGQLLGSGVFPVSGTPGQPASFSPSLTFQLPAGGGNIQVEIFDQNALNGQVVASASVMLVVLPPPPTAQQIIIETPPPGTTVGSPVVITGRTTQFPFEGNLNYRISSATGQQLGSGNFQVTGEAGGPARFNESFTFTEPADGGLVNVEIFEPDAATGGVRASTSINLTVDPPPQTPTPQPTRPATTPTPVAQEIIIETPDEDTVVGSPAVITGRTTRFPFEGNLIYRVLDAQGDEIGRGAFTVESRPDQTSDFEFDVSITFVEPPGGGEITVEIFEQDAATGDVVASDEVVLQVDPPRPTPRT